MTLSRLMTHNMSWRWRRPKRTPLCITGKNERIARALPVGNLQYYGQSHEDGVFVHIEVFEVRLKRIKCIYIRVAGAIYTSGLPEPPIFEIFGSSSRQIPAPAPTPTPSHSHSHSQRCGAGPFLTGSGSSFYKKEG